MPHKWLRRIKLHILTNRHSVDRVRVKNRWESKTREVCLSSQGLHKPPLGIQEKEGGRAMSGRNSFSRVQAWRQGVDIEKA